MLAADENAGPRVRPGQLGRNVLGGLKPSEAFGGKAGAPTAQGKPGAGRRALLDVTNSAAVKLLPLSTSGGKPQAPAPLKAQRGVADVERPAGKGWRAQEEELQQREEAALTQRLLRVQRGAASTWAHRGLMVYEDDDCDAGDATPLTRSPEPPIIVQLRTSTLSDVLLEVHNVHDSSTLLPQLPHMGVLDLSFDF